MSNGRVKYNNAKKEGLIYYVCPTLPTSFRKYILRIFTVRNAID